MSVAVMVTAFMGTVVQAQQPTVVFSIRGIEPLLDDAEFIGGELGQEGAKETAEQLIRNFTAGKGLAGVEQDKPLGLYWNATAAGEPEMPVLFVPVADADALKELLTELAPERRTVSRSRSTRFPRRSVATSSPRSPMADAIAVVLPPGEAHASNTRSSRDAAASSATSCEASSCTVKRPLSASAVFKGFPPVTVSPAGA